MTDTKLAGEAMTDAEISDIATRIYGTQATEQELRFARALLASKAAVPEGWKLVPATLTGGMVDAYRTYWAHTQNIYGAWSAMLAASPTAPAQLCGDAEQADEAVTADVFDWLETEVTAISCRYHGDPSYDHDAYWMRDRVVKLIEEARNAFAARAKDSK